MNDYVNVHTFSHYFYHVNCIDKNLNTHQSVNNQSYFNNKFNKKKQYKNNLNLYFIITT